MTSFEYIKSKLELIVSKFPTAKVLYEYANFSDTHIIQVEPFELYDSNQEYREFETDVSIEFDDKFFPESILFVSNESLNNVTSPECEMYGMYYNMQPEKIDLPMINFNWATAEYLECCENNFALAA